MGAAFRAVRRMVGAASGQADRYGDIRAVGVVSTRVQRGNIDLEMIRAATRDIQIDY